MTEEQIRKGIESLGHSINESKAEMESIKKSLINDLNDDIFDEYTLNLIESKVKKLRNLSAKIEEAESKISLSLFIINN